MQKNITAEELHKLIMNKRVTYEQIRKIDASRFYDLESTMRMLFDHGTSYNEQDYSSEVQNGLSEAGSAPA